MALLNTDDRISVKKFASIPALIHLGLPEVKREPISLSGASSRSSAGSSEHYDIALEEGCMITKSVRYTHEVIHWVNVAHSSDPAPVVTMIDQGLRMLPYTAFTLDDECNIAFLEPSVYASLDLYAFIALTPSLQTLNRLIDIVKCDNDRRQEQMDRGGYPSWRSLDFSDASFTNPEYELVVLHPEHFLPGGGIFTVYDRANNGHKNYVVSNDRRLRESIDYNSPRLPSFSHDAQHRKSNPSRVNVFLVAINADIKFRRYFRMAEQLPPLPPDVIELMRRVTYLIDLIYWEPVPTKGSKGEVIYNARGIAQVLKRKKPPRSTQLGYIENERTSSAESAGEDVSSPRKKRSELLLEERRFDEWWRSVDFETRRAYGTAIMCGHGLRSRTV
ncbi:hypothetical protein JOM56_009862 [Amanita muscaria]